MRISILVLLAFSLMLAACNNDNGGTTLPNNNPTITGINPTNFAIGERSVDLTITGTNLNGVVAVSLGNGITVHSASASSPTTVSVKLTVQQLAVAGKRDVTVVTGIGTATASGILTIQGHAPEAQFTVSPKDISQSTDVEFDGSSSTDSDGSIKQYSWDFGDGKRATGQKVTHKFVAGNYDVSLSVTDNENNTGSRIKSIEVKDRVEVKCTTPASNNGFLGATVIGVEGHYAIVQMGAGRTCANSFYLCGDMRLDEPEEFRGIISEMYSLGNNQFKVLNDCPYRWPPKIGEYDVLIYKRCSDNHCP
jgi:PKD domain-containing protein/quinohemoprotein amine dehydrogenase alpha subunit-like protein